MIGLIKLGVGGSEKGNLTFNLDMIKFTLSQLPPPAFLIKKKLSETQTTFCLGTNTSVKIAKPF